jgi:AbrB family looped-hinge helix DNA binding protein
MVVRGTTKLTRKGQMTVPAEIRRALSLKEGDRLIVTYDEATGRATFESAMSLVERTAGILKPKRRLPGDIYEVVAEEKRQAREDWQRAAIERDMRSKER